MDYAFLKYIGRWRHAHGYGVHSPLAYRIVKDCIKPNANYGFYSDAYLDFEYHEDRKNLRDAKMALRLINLLRPKRIWMPAADKRLCTALKMSFPKIQVTTQKECPKNTDFIICNGVDNCEGFWKKIEAQPECGMLAFGKEMHKIGDATLMICNKRFTIAIKRVGMDFVSYSV